MAPVHVLFTVGHSTRPLPELVDLLREHHVKLLVDVRTTPKSGTNPQFNRDQLEKQLPEQYDMQYLWLGRELGGLRKRDKSSELNAGWDNASFRGYADYMQSPEFRSGVQQLMQVAQAQGPAAIMCAEAVHWRCHRRLVSDALLVAGWQVQHLTAAGKQPTQHTITSFADVQGAAITYPAYQHEQAGHGKGYKQKAKPVKGEEQQQARQGRRKGAKTGEGISAAAAAAAAPTAAAAAAPTAAQKRAGSTAKRHAEADVAESKQLLITVFTRSMAKGLEQRQQQQG